jgi:hypothetical protein
MSINQQIIDKFKTALNPAENPPIFLYPCNSNDDINNRYASSRKVFNRRFDFMPPLIIQVRDTEQVATAIRIASEHNIEITVRSGGHDHEGECVATGKVLIDFSLMNNVQLHEDFIKIYCGEDKLIRQVTIQPGARFSTIKPILDKAWLGIPHGTCQSVAIAGYTMGGGWGPWTRMYGMACERLYGATIVLGDGSIKYLGTSAIYNKEKRNSANQDDFDIEGGKLLWALRGGGGLSYGIVTEFFYEPFELPELPISFVLTSSEFPVLKKISAVNIIKSWEQIIAPENNPQLIGTNLQVIAKGVTCESEISADAILDWSFNGHFGGTCVELKSLFDHWADIIIELINEDTSYCPEEKEKMIDDVKHVVVVFLAKHCSSDNALRLNLNDDSKAYPFTFESWDRFNNEISIDSDCPAPHKITSKMPTQGWNDESRKQLVCSLQSQLLNNDEATNISAYITLGAISGQYYKNKATHPDNFVHSAFPYSDRAFTIQYQAWWNQPTDTNCTLNPEVKSKLIATRLYENRAQDWIEAARNFSISNTSGSFISFKDSSIPTKSYFGDNYKELISVKLNKSKDDKNLFRSRKTII